MRKILLVFALLLFFGQSCQSPGQKRAFDYNNKLAGITKENQTKWVAFGKEISVAEQSHDYSKLASMTNELIDFLDKKIAEVEAMGTPPGGEDLKNAAIDFLRFDKSIAEEKAIPYTLMNAQTTDEEFQNATQALFAQADLEEPYHAKMLEAQKAFAKKNGFRLEQEKK